MPKFSSLAPKKILRILERAGFKVDHITGSHYILFNPLTGKRVTLPFHTKDLPKGTIHSIFKAAEITKKDLKKYL
jgi:predicted RNA binding protein YcfA (HicA-like mRNA interferase family)